MKFFDDFQEALAEWQEDGGAMNFYGAFPGEDGSVWAVGLGEEIREVIFDCSIREATVNALREGGLSEPEISEAMMDWQD